MPSTADKRARDKRYNARRPFSHSWYKQPEWCHPISGRRALQLKAEPNCRMCAKAGTVKPGRNVDHVERHGGDPVKFWQGELQTLCDHHHNSVKQSMERNPRHVIGPDGWPLDPNVKRPKGGRSISGALNAGTARLHFFAHLQFRKFSQTAESHGKPSQTT